MVLGRNPDIDSSRPCGFPKIHRIRAASYVLLKTYETKVHRP